MNKDIINTWIWFSFDLWKWLGSIFSCIHRGELFWKNGIYGEFCVNVNDDSAWCHHFFIGRSYEELNRSNRELHSGKAAALWCSLKTELRQWMTYLKYVSKAMTWKAGILGIPVTESWHFGPHHQDRKGPPSHERCVAKIKRNKPEDTPNPLPDSSALRYWVWVWSYDTPKRLESTNMIHHHHPWLP